MRAGKNWSSASRTALASSSRWVPVVDDPVPRRDVALALSHHRLAEERRRAAALEERTANLELLEGLLATLAGVLDVRQVFEQVSAIARKVIPHDMVSLPLISDDREHIIVYAVTGNEAAFPITVPMPEDRRHLLTAPWEYLIHPDLQADPAERALPPGQAGYRGRLTVPIRLNGSLVGGVDFFSFQPHCYTPDHVLVARLGPWSARRSRRRSRMPSTTNRRPPRCSG